MLPTTFLSLLAAASLASASCGPFKLAKGEKYSMDVWSKTQCEGTHGHLTGSETRGCSACHPLKSGVSGNLDSFFFTTTSASQTVRFYSDSGCKDYIGASQGARRYVSVSGSDEVACYFNQTPTPGGQSPTLGL
ncbi:hypothetical protein BV22DRAFT_500519 [Leucogyrophana mollusca]|uniref:Uncharacterized protein n=1 Tax=Leucogyrophana mollusca TaxID=85980 RepID=A0ACB8BG96_9AGAM|nr:hypothetical protein BV22DRAFT_500519 [Leucogyrophana mollusca]